MACASARSAVARLVSPAARKPLGALVQRCRGDAQREVVEAELLLPDVVRRLAPARGREREVDAQQTLGVGQRSRGESLRRATLVAPNVRNHRSTTSARNGGPSCCGRAQREMSSVPSGFTRVSAYTASPNTVDRSSPRRYCSKSGVTLRRQCGDATSARPSSACRDRLKRTKSAKCVSAAAPRCPAS